MKIIRKESNPSGAYPGLQDWNSQTIPEGVAVWPDTLDTVDFYAHNGFVDLTVEQVDGVDTVVSYTPNTEAWEAWKDGEAAKPQVSDSDTGTSEPVTWGDLASAIREGVNEV